LIVGVAIVFLQSRVEGCKEAKREEAAEGGGDGEDKQ
jgi:hypothetical protein